MLSQDAIKEFQDIYFREFGIRLTKAEAEEQASNLIRLYKSLLEDNFVNEKTDTENL